MGGVILEQKFTTEVYASKKEINLNLKEIIKSKDLIKMFVKKNFTALYKQTILGPAWIVINPLMTSVIFTFIFGELAGISTDGVPQILFYMSGNILWTLVSSNTNSVATTFISNSGMFEKVYFTRLSVPIATTITSFLNFLLQLSFYFIFFIYYFITGSEVSFAPTIILLPIVIIQMMILSMGVGLIITSITSKYRDLIYVFPVLVQLWMYVTPIVYPASTLGGITRIVVMLNPVSTAVEIFRFSLLNAGHISWGYWALSLVTTLLMFVIGILAFKKTEKNFVDVI